MKFFKLSLMCLGVSLFLCVSCKLRESDDMQNENKSAIILATFGSSYEVPQLTFKNIEEAAIERFPQEEIHWAYTSSFIIKKLREGRGQGVMSGKSISIYTPTETLERLIKEGYTNFYMQSLHIIPGEEFEELHAAVEEVKEQYKNVEIKIGKPLLDSDVDIKIVAQILAQKFSAEIKQGPVVFMGHGTPHHADAQYGKLQTELHLINPDFYVGTVEGIGFDDGSLSIDGIITKMKNRATKASTVTITPLMSIAGDHANNDMNANTGKSNPAEQSWRERLVAEGYAVNANMNGLGDYAEINAVWMNHLETIREK